jgi:starch-binding outer membrane protein, SusD/RagB family
MRKIKNISFILGLIFIVHSCKHDFVELTNPNAITTGSFWQNEKDAIAGVNSVYSALYYDGLYMRLYPWIMDIRADDMRNTSPWWTQEVMIYQVTPGNPCYIAPWEHNYAGIFWANQVLTYVPAIEMDETLKARILGEAKFLRGLYYYHLLNVYRDVPLITTLPAGLESFFPAKTPRDLVWEHVIKDFSDAMEVLPTKQQYPAADMGRATKGAAAGYLGKTYMIIGDWARAEPILKGIIDQQYGTYSLVPDYRDNFTTRNQNNSESLFEVQFSRSVGGTELGWAGNPSSAWSKTSGKARTYAPLGFGWGDVTPTDWIFELFQEERTVDDDLDPRMKASMFFDYPGSMVYGRPWNEVQASLPNHVHVRKYLNDDDYPNEGEWRSEINERILRYADILLLYAECLNELGRTQDAYPYIQQVRDRANLPNLATTRPNMNQVQMREWITRERALEFCFEAIRYVDILRWGWLEDDNMIEVLKERDAEFNNFIKGRHFMAIPPNEVDLNKNLDQDPGW